MSFSRERIQAVVDAVLEGRTGNEVEYKIGTMIEIPRAALTAGDIAQYANSSVSAPTT